MILLFMALGIIFIISFSGVFAYLACKLYIRVRDAKSSPQPLLGVVYPKDEEE